MRIAVFAVLAVAILAPGAALAQTSTFCTPVGNTVLCNTSAAPQTNSGLDQSEANFGSALGTALGGIAERVRERREAEAEARAEADYSQQQQAAAAAAASGPTPEQLQAEVRAFAADPAHPYFDAEKDRMVAILQANQAQTLERAYDMALAQDPAVQSVLAKGH
jgi:hypothetical protein